MIPLHQVVMDPSAGEKAAAVLQSGFVGQGAVVDEFKRKLGETLGNPNVVLVNSATSGITLALAMNQRGEFVHVPPLTCAATVMPICTLGMTPRWLDVDPRTLNADLEHLREDMSAQTSAVILVHWGGYPADLDKVDEIKREFEIKYHRPLTVIEDCAHAWGSRYREKFPGNHGNIAVYSFGPVKSLTCGFGGAVVFPTEGEAIRARRLRWYGLDRKDRTYGAVEPGYNFQMNDVSAAVGLANLPVSRMAVTQQKWNANYYDSRLGEIGGLRLLERRPGHEASFWLYSTLVERRDEFIRALASRGVEAGTVHSRVDRLPLFDNKRALPGLDSIEAHYVCLPNGAWVTDDKVGRVVDAIRKGW